MTRRTLFQTAVVLCLCGSSLHGQSVRSLVNGGNDHYDKNQYPDSEVKYRKALEKEKELVEGHFNLGDALYKQGKFADAAREYDQALQKTSDKERKSFAYYNIGNSLVKSQDLQNAAKAYIQSLKLKPDDGDTKHNLSYVLRMMQQQQQQQQKSGDNKDQNQKNKQNQQNKDQQKQQQDQQKQQQQQQQQQASQREKRISKEDAERILAVLKNNEKEVQKKLRVRAAVRPKTDKDW